MPEYKTTTETGGEKVVSIAALRAAEVAAKRGEDPFKAAQQVYLAERQAPSPPEPEQTTADEPDYERRYLLALCRYSRGTFAALTATELLDVACLTTIAALPFPDWKKNVKDFEKK